MFFQVGKILFSLAVSRCSKSFIVLNLPVSSCANFPQLIIGLGEKINSFSAVLASDDWSDKFFKKTMNPAEGRPESLKKVDNQPFNMRTIDILISHYHH